MTFEQCLDIGDSHLPLQLFLLIPVVAIACTTAAISHHDRHSCSAAVAGFSLEIADLEKRKFNASQEMPAHTMKIFIQTVAWDSALADAKLQLIDIVSGFLFPVCLFVHGVA